MLSFPPHLVREYLDKFAVSAQQQVLDPFCGTGTTIVECQKQGISSVGIESNFMACFAATIKLDWSIPPTHLLQVAQQVAEATEALIRQERVPTRTLPADKQQIMLKNAISPLPLHKTLILLEQIHHWPDQRCRDYLQLALAKALTSGISNLRWMPEVGIGKVKADAPVVSTWLQAVTEMAKDLPQLQPLVTQPGKILHGDAREVINLLPPQSVDVVITSPPYPNEKDYTRTTRLESVLLDFVRNKQELRELKQGLVCSNTRNVFVANTDDLWVAKHPEVQRIAQQIETRRGELGKTSGFSRLYPRAVKLYFGGMARHLAELRPVLRPGAQLAYVVGDQRSYLQVMIRTGELLADIAQALGYELIGVDLFRTRLASVTQEQMREEVVMLRWPGQLPGSPYPFGDVGQ